VAERKNPRPYRKSNPVLPVRSLGVSEDNVKMYRKETVCKDVDGFKWIRVEFSGELL